MTHGVTDRHPAQALRRCATTPKESLSAPEERGDVRSADTILHSNPIRRSAAMTHGVTDRHPAQALRRCATTPEESLSAFIPESEGDVRSADTLSVNFYLCTINRKLRETLRIVKKKDRDGELLC